jgi:hypothetical protein
MIVDSNRLWTFTPNVPRLESVEQAVSGEVVETAERNGRRVR